MTTVPASLFVNVQPSVLNAGGSALDLLGLMLTNSTRVPTGSILSFANGAAVAAYFGSGSTEARIASGGAGYGSGYFGGFTGCTKLPGAILFAQFPQTTVSAWLRGGNISGVPLATVKAINGTLTVVMDGLSYVGGSLNLSGGASLSAIATLIQSALNTSVPNAATFTASIATTVLTVTAVASGIIAPGQTVAGGTTSGGTKVTNQLTSTEVDGHLGGKGTYTVNNSQTVVSGTLTTSAPLVVTYDSQSGAFQITSGSQGATSTAAFATGTAAASLLLTAATGAVLSQGANAAAPSAFMDSMVQISQNWASFMTTFDPDNGSGNTNKLAFAGWVNGQNNRYAYVCWDTDTTPSTTLPAAASLGAILQGNASSGTIPIWCDVDRNYAAFVCGYGASLDFSRKNGRSTLAYRGQTGLVPTVLSSTVLTNLMGSPQTTSFGNGYNGYCAIATANQSFIDMQRGTVTGPFQWVDSYFNQIWLNNSFQLALMQLLQNVGSVPYNSSGYNLVEAALNDPINAGLNFGAIRAGVPLSAVQAAEVNNAAGMLIDNVLSTRGWYLQIVPATALIRQARTSPSMTFWYMDGESIQSINLASIMVQ